MPDTLPDSQALAELRLDRWSRVPEQPGIYWWFFPATCLESFQIADHCDVQALRLRPSGDGKLCLYVGVASSLQERMKWHADQPLKQSALRSGFLSTFRKTLLVLNQIDYDSGFDAINAFMDGLNVAWHTTPDLPAAQEMETTELKGAYHYPLNIQGNRSPALKPFLTFLKLQRKEYSTRFLIPPPD